MKYEYTLKRSKRKTLSMEVTRDLQIIVRVPNKCPQKTIDEFVNKYENWLDKAIEKQSRREIKNELTPQQVDELKKKAKEILPAKVEYYSNLMQLYPTGIKITSAKKRFGSCSGKNSICFSLYLMQYPEEAIDYVVVHELAHIAYKSHCKKFYELIAKYMPDYKTRNKMLKDM